MKKNNNDDYFVCVEMPYEGITIKRTSTLDYALIEYNFGIEQVKRGYFSGVLLIKGKLLKQHGKISVD